MDIAGEKFDVIVVGAGNAATCAALSAREAGARVVMLEIAPEEAGMHLIRQPTEPHWLPAFHVTFRLKSPPDSWRDYLYWNIELDI